MRPSLSGQDAAVPTLLVIIGSTRPGRAAEPVADWFVACATAHGAFELDVADLAVIDLPLFDEPNHPSRHEYVHDHTKAWSARVEAADAIVLVSPEYNTGTTAVLKNAIDYLNREWKYKPVGFVTYGGVSGGVRAMEHLVQVSSILGMIPVLPAVNIPFIGKLIDVDRRLQANDVMAKAATGMLDELRKVEAATRSLRSR
jgi:NAD(P)H-dependent FMN reductase